MNDQQLVQRARQAGEVIDNPAYKEAMQTLKDSITAQWLECPVRDKEGQVLLLQLAKITAKFEGILTGLVEQGKMAQRKIELDTLRDEPPVRNFMRRVLTG